MQSQRTIGRRELLAGSAAGILALAGCGSSQSKGGSSSTGARFAYASTSPLASVLAAQQLKTWDDAGVSVKVDQVNDVGLATDLTNGRKAQFGHSAPTTAFAAMSQGVPLKILASLGFGQGEHQAGYLTAPASSGIRSLKDLGGKKVAVTGIGTSYDFYLRAALKGVGLSTKDVQIVPVPYPQMKGALDQGQVDAALLLAVDYAGLKAEKKVNVVDTTAGLADAPIEITGCVVARTDWLKDNEKSAVGFLAGLLKAESWIEKDVASHQGAKTVKLLQPVLKYDKPTMRDYVTYRLLDIGQESKLGGLLRMPHSFVDPALKALEAGGGIPGKTKVTYESAIDLSYLKKAYKKAGLAWNEDVKYA
ncbi:ABC transporter substrate-binding protein [Streptomyces sp. NPDC050560]|uniref:ABC transporter substrate-binding protein n=1 Tax=Streptomyces sp. NPDC050560 TaxID=3365630 RepID=UPI0037A3DD8E